MKPFPDPECKPVPLEQAIKQIEYCAPCLTMGMKVRPVVMATYIGNLCSDCYEMRKAQGLISNRIPRKL